MRRAQLDANAPIPRESPHERPRSRQNFPPSSHVPSHSRHHARTSDSAARLPSCGNGRGSALSYSMLGRDDLLYLDLASFSTELFHPKFSISQRHLTIKALRNPP
jgi:hypothetical protein